MKKIIACTLSFALLSSGSLMCDECIQNTETYTDELWRVGDGSRDGSFTAVGTSMLGWGLGLGTAIGIIAAVLHQSNVAHADTDCD